MKLLKQLFTKHVEHLKSRYHEHIKTRDVSGSLIFSGAPELFFLDDTDKPFRVNPHFIHFVPLTKHPFCFLWLPNDSQSKPTLFYYRKEDYWYTPAPMPHGYYVDADVFNIEVIDDMEKVRVALADKLKNCFFIGEMTQAMKATWGFRTELTNEEEYLKWVHYLRTEKTPYEQECIRLATAKAVKAHLHVRDRFLHDDDCNELDLHLAYLKMVRSTENDQPYGNIVALNENASVLHFTDFGSSNVNKADRFSLLVDAGARVAGYAADITRTYSSDPKDEFGELVAAMDSMLLRIISEFKLGQSYVDNHLKAHQYIGEILRDFNFVYGLSPEVMIEKKITHKFFPHGLGHSLGIQVHDVGGLRSRPPADHPTLRNTQELSLGHVFTVEPGIYFIDMLLADLKKSSETEPYINWSKVDKFKRYGGIRIEDNVIVQANQFENVTRAAYQKI